MKSQLFNLFISNNNAPEADKPARWAKYLSENLHATLAIFEKKISLNKSVFLVGDSLTALDLAITTFLDMHFITYKITSEEVLLADFPLVRSNRNMVRAVPAIATWNKAHDQ